MRVRKELIEFIQWSVDRHFIREDFHQAKRPSEWIAYLEKQKECLADNSKTSASEDEKIRKELIFFLKEEIPQCSIKEHADKLKKFVSYLAKQKEQKSAEWSEEDEKMLWSTINGLNQDIYEEERDWLANRLKFLRPSCKPVEWSDEEFETFRKTLAKDAFLDEITSIRVAKKLLNSVKHLRPSWKPSEEQMGALEECGECKRCIKELREQLQKLWS